LWRHAISSTVSIALVNERDMSSRSVRGTGGPTTGEVDAASPSPSPDHDLMVVDLTYTPITHTPHDIRIVRDPYAYSTLAGSAYSTAASILTPPHATQYARYAYETNGLATSTPVDKTVSRRYATAHRIGVITCSVSILMRPLFISFFVLPSCCRRMRV
jgi:hypothetical protein